MNFKVGDKVQLHPEHKENKNLDHSVIFEIVNIVYTDKQKIILAGFEFNKMGFSAERFVLEKKYLHNKEFAQKFDRLLEE